MKCRTSQSALSQAENGRSKRNWSTSEESSIRSRSKMEQRRLELAKKQGSTELEAQNLAELQRAERAVSEYQSVSVDLMQLHPQEFNRMENTLSRTLGIHKKLLGIGDDLTQAGGVKLQIADMMQSAQNLIDVTGRYAFKKTTNEALTDINALLRQRGIDPDSAKEFINHVGEVAKSPRQRVAYGNTEPVNKIISKRYNDMMDEAQKLGLGTDDMNVIVDRLTRAMSSVDDVHAMAKILGASMGSVENIGYMMRTFTDKAEKFFKLQSVDVSQWSKRAVGTSSVQRSRESWALIPEDYEVLATYLTPGKYKSWNDSVAEYIQEARKIHIDKLELRQKVEAQSYKTLDKAEADLARKQQLLERAMNAKKPNAIRIAALQKQVDDAVTWYKGASDSAMISLNTSSWLQLVDLHSTIAKRYDLGKVAGRKAFLNDIVDTPADFTDILKRYDGDETKAMQFLSDLTGKPLGDLDSLRFGDLNDMVVDLHKMADDGMALTQYLHKNLTAQQLDDLVDAGILHKLEMTTRELADYISRQYNLPYQKAIGMFEMDILKRLDRYTNQLRKSAGESNLIKNILTQGTDNGWAIPTSLMTEEHKGFVKLGDIDLSRFGLDSKLVDEWQGVYVHPTVHNQMKAYLELSTNAGKLSQFANVWSYVLRNFNLATLADSGVPFLSRNVIAGTINYLAGGGNMARVIPSIHQYAKVMGKGGLEALDDTRKIVRWPGTSEVLTQREAFKRMFIKRGTDYVSAESGNVLGLNKSGSPLNRIVSYAGQSLPVIALPNAIRAQFEYAKYMGEGWGLKEAAKLGTGQLQDYIRTVFAPIAYGNAVVDGGLKWAWMMTHLESTDGVLGKLDDFGSYVTGGGKQFKDAAEMFDEMDNYFINSFTSGTVQKGLSKYVIPFGSFAMASTPMAIRHAIRNPNQFMAYSRMIRMNHRENMKDPDIRESGFSEFELAALPMTLFKDYKNKGQVLTLFPTNVDMYQGSLAYLAKQGQRVGRLVNEGGFVGQGVKDRKQLRDPYNLREFITDNLKDNQNPVMAIVSELLSGKDSLGRDIDKNTRTDIGGATIDPSMYWVLSKLPGFRTATGLAGGRGAITGPDGTVQAPAQPGLFGTPQREATRTEEARYRAGKFVGDETYGVIRNVLGLDVRTIDLAEGRQHTLKDVRFTISALQKRLNDYSSKAPTPENAAQREVIANQILQLKTDEHRVTQWLTANKVPDPKALKKLYKDGITVRSLPVDNDTMNKYITEYMNAVNGTTSTPSLTPARVALP